MRKLKPLELAALSALFSIGANVDAQDAEESMPTNLHRLHVQGNYDPFVTYYTPGNWNFRIQPGVPYSFGLAPSKPNKALPDAATRARARNCVLQYAQHYPILNPQYSLEYSPLWAFKDDNSNLWMYPNNYATPITYPGQDWREGYATTNYTQKQITIYQAGYGSFARLVNALAHEFAHSWDMDENNAKAMGDDTMDRFLQDGGAQCGGL
ncbi:hypothetical protein V3391_07610 [Luteimonas sp. SMYT11W]|uniref:Uncharacterized protein n=1 Tax=Luteimonas flava TaxID=3115822 RepID=A0ABU7WDP2_9GAMM